MYALIDCNNFYASCQRVFRPELNGKPVVILSNNDGCIIARSQEAKDLGIKMGDPYFKNIKLLNDNNVNVFSSNYALYQDMSNRVMTILSDYSPESEIYSIDECFLKLNGYENFNLQEYGTQMHKRVLRCTGIPVSVGIAPTKALAKIANKIAKKFAKIWNNSYVIDTEEKRIKALKWTKIGDVWGIGRQYATKLQAQGVMNAYDFVMLPDAYVRKLMSVVGLRLKHDLEGKSSIDFEEIKDKQNIACTRAFDARITEKVEMRERISTYTGVVAEKLRKDNLHCNSISVFVMTNPFSTGKIYHKSIRMKTPFPTNSTLEMNKMAIQLLELAWQDGWEFAKAGVIVGSITRAENYQTNLFIGENPRHLQLMKAMDGLNKKYGDKKIRIASQDLKKTWKMRREFLSPNYTTNWNDLITANCTK